MLIRLRFKMSKKQEMYGEICGCGHLKECHNPHILDKHGGECSHCDCKIYTWNDFIWINKK